MDKNVLARLLQMYSAQPQGNIVSPPRVYPVPQYKSGPIDQMVLPRGLPNDRNTFDPNYMVRSNGENV